MKPLHEPAAEEAHDPKALRARGREHLSEAERCFEAADRIEQAGPADELLDRAGVERCFPELSMDTIVAALDRGEAVEVLFAGAGTKRRHKPMVWRSEVARWLRDRKPARPRPRGPVPAIDVTAELRAAARRSA